MAVDAADIPQGEPPVVPPEQAGMTGAGGGSFLSRRVLGFPLWAWGIILIGGGILAWVLVKNFGANSQSGQADTGQVNGLAIDPSTGLPYGTNGQGGINPAGAFAGETTYDPFANTNALLQQLLNQQQAQVNPPTSSGDGSTNPLTSGYYQTTKASTLSQVAALFGTTGSDLYYNAKNAGLKNFINDLWGIQGKPGDPAGKFNTTILPAGTWVFVGTPQALQNQTPQVPPHGRNPVDPLTIGPLAG